eukprot:m.128028 g.128028  ORF g.128028 m.128028 type:complete len:210 (-) comp14556_c0_seq7:508-1137(-)
MSRFPATQPPPHQLYSPNQPQYTGQTSYAPPRAPHTSSLPPGPNGAITPNMHGRKIALLIGITYRGTSGELAGCINDIKCMKFLLTKRCGYSEENIVMLSEEERDPKRKPTRQNIMNWIDWLVSHSQPGDRLFFQYSGHGGRSRDRTGEELDGYNETILPLDYKRNGQIVDDELNRVPPYDENMKTILPHQIPGFSWPSSFGCDATCCC